MKFAAHKDLHLLKNLYPSLVKQAKIYNADWKIQTISGLAHKSYSVRKISKIEEKSN